MKPKKEELTSRLEKMRAFIPSQWTLEIDMFQGRDVYFFGFGGLTAEQIAEFAEFNFHDLSISHEEKTLWFSDVRLFDCIFEDDSWRTRFLTMKAKHEKELLTARVKQRVEQPLQKHDPSGEGGAM